MIKVALCSNGEASVRLTKVRPLVRLPVSSGYCKQISHLGI